MPSVSSSSLYDFVYGDWLSWKFRRIRGTSDAVEITFLNKKLIDSGFTDHTIELFLVLGNKRYASTTLWARWIYYQFLGPLTQFDVI